MFKVKDAVTSLEDLCRALNSDTKRRIQCHRVGMRPLESENFPTFGGLAPPDVSGVWSWDATRMLFADSMGHFYIEPRDPEAWYPNEKKLSLR